MEQVAYREAFLGEFRRVNPERVDEFIESDFWQSALFSPENNYEYRGAGVELYCADTWRIVSLNFGLSFLLTLLVYDQNNFFSRHIISFFTLFIFFMYLFTSMQKTHSF